MKKQVEASRVPLKTRSLRSVLTVGLTLLLISVALYVTPDPLLHWHYILQRLLYLPIIVAGLVMGWREGAITAVLASVAYLLRRDSQDPFDLIDRFLEATMFCLVGILTGVLSERERLQREDLQATAKRLEEVYRELQNNVEHLKRAARMSALGHLSAGLAHEIRNPLASIEGAAYIAQREPDGAHNAEFFEIIRKETQRLNNLLTHFLEFARPREPHLQPVNPQELINSVFTLVERVAAQSKVQLRKEFAENGQLLECDGEQMKQVLLNLVLNSIQAQPNGGEILVSTEEKKSMLVMRVSDKGPGIASESADEIFDPFFTTKQNGTGLGLPIAYQIVKQHGGELLLEKNSSVGCCFAIRLPFGPGSRL
jgi:two-component system, NtrC family, sensor histidine kinase HydH